VAGIDEGKTLIFDIFTVSARFAYRGTLRKDPAARRRYLSLTEVGAHIMFSLVVRRFKAERVIRVRLDDLISAAAQFALAMPTARIMAVQQYSRSTYQRDCVLHGGMPQ